MYIIKAIFALFVIDDWRIHEISLLIFMDDMACACLFPVAVVACIAQRFHFCSIFPLA